MQDMVHLSALLNDLITGLVVEVLPAIISLLPTEPGCRLKSTFSLLDYVAVSHNIVLPIFLNEYRYPPCSSIRY